MNTRRAPVMSLAAVCLGVVCLGATGFTGGRLRAADEFLRGDANSDGTLSISDAITIKLFLFTGGRPPSCMDTADIDDDGFVNITDEIRILLEFLPTRPGEVWSGVIAAPFPEAGADPTEDEVGCESYEVAAPEETADLVRLGDVTAAPGEAVEIPVFVTNEVALDAVQIVVDYDPATFTPGEAINFADTFFGEPPHEIRGFAALKAWPEDGVFTVAIIGDIGPEDRRIPPGEETLIAKIPGTVSEDVEPGSVLSLEARTEGFGDHGLRTELTHRGEARFISTLPNVEGALLQIVGDLTFFRGDANGDETLTLSDAQFILNYLFVAGSAPPPCFDAADANDDGRVDLADAITTLSYLFESSAPLPPPHPDKGLDPTADTLSCLGSR